MAFVLQAPFSQGGDEWRIDFVFFNWKKHDLCNREWGAETQDIIRPR